MKANENDIVQYIEPVFQFCNRRLNSRNDAEDLASEIMVCLLDGIKKYKIVSLHAWVWRIAHNRYARFIEARNKRYDVPVDDVILDKEDDYDFVDAIAVKDEYEAVFKYLHTLSNEYRNLAVDYYIGELAVKEIAAKYSLTESTVKWRLNMSREKIKDRIGDNRMDRVYKRINWQTTTCNGAMNSNKYLYSQIARAICEAAYEKPLTVEEISLKTGIPAMYIEDELPRLIQGDAIEREGNKYATNFIIYRLCDKKAIEDCSRRVVTQLTDYYEKLFSENGEKVAEMSFTGSSFGMKRLGYIAIPASLRGKVESIKKSLPGFEDGPFPPRKDGDYGWYIVQETEDEQETMPPYSSGCNITDDENNYIYYYWIAKYFDNNIYHNGGTRWLSANKIPEKSHNGVIPDGLLTEDDIIRLLKVNLIEKCGTGYRLFFTCFNEEEFNEFVSLFRNDDIYLTGLLTEMLCEIKKRFVSFVPKRLDSQINQYISCSINCIGEVTEELIKRGVLEKPGDDKKLTNGVFYISGRYKNV